MDYFFKTVIGSAPPPDTQPDPIDTVGRLVERVTSSTLLEDKRDACRALKGLSKKYRVQVGAQGLDALIDALNAVDDQETASYVLETLCNITSFEPFDGEEQPIPYEAFTEILLKRPENVTSVISLLDVYDVKVRLPAIRLLMNLLTNKSKEMQDIVLASPMGVSKLIDILVDKREFVRNEALLLLIQLTKSNTTIQNIIAYERGFIHLFEVIRNEGYSEGDITVEDSLSLMLNLLKRNASNQTVFREESCMKLITPFFQSCQKSETNPDNSWSSRRISNVHSMLQVVRTLVSPSNAAQLTLAAQKTAASCELLNELVKLLLTEGVPAEILSEIICTVGETIRGCPANQEAFGRHTAVPGSPPKSVLAVLLICMVTEKQPVALRASILYCFQCYVHRNEASQGHIVKALVPASAEDMQPGSPGQLLCRYLFSTDCLSQWFAAVALSHALVGNTVNKERLLLVKLAVSKDAPPVTLLHQTFNLLLQQGGKMQTRLGVLTLLSTWLAECPNAVAQFLQLSDSVAFLTAQVASNEHDEQEALIQSLCAFLLGLCVVFNNDSVPSFTKGSLCQLITKRISVETFVDKLAEVSKSEMYSKALKHPQNRIKVATEVQLDHEFCRLYKALEGTLAKAVAPSKGAESPSEVELKAELEKHKETIGERDAHIEHLKQRLASLEFSHIAAQSKIEELNVSLSQLTDQNTLLKVQRNNNVIIGPADAARQSEATEKLVQEVQALRLDNDRLRSQIDECNSRPRNDGMVVEQVSQASIMDCFQVTPQHEESQIFSLFRRTEPETTSKADAAELKATQDRLQAVESELADLKRQLGESVAQNASLVEEIDRVKKDQEDLLVLLADQDTQVQKYKDRLKALDQMVSDEEEEELEDGDEDDI